MRCVCCADDECFVSLQQSNSRCRYHFRTLGVTNSSAIVGLTRLIKILTIEPLCHPLVVLVLRSEFQTISPASIGDSENESRLIFLAVAKRRTLSVEQANGRSPALKACCRCSLVLQSCAVNDAFHLSRLHFLHVSRLFLYIWVNCAKDTKLSGCIVHFLTNEFGNFSGKHLSNIFVI